MIFDIFWAKGLWTYPHQYNEEYLFSEEKDQGSKKKNYFFFLDEERVGDLIRIKAPSKGDSFVSLVLLILEDLDLLPSTHVDTLR